MNSWVRFREGDGWFSSALLDAKQAYQPSHSGGGGCGGRSLSRPAPAANVNDSGFQLKLITAAR